MDREHAVRASDEGAVGWHPIENLPEDQLVPDLPPLLELVLRDGEVCIGESELDPQRGALGLSIR